MCAILHTKVGHATESSNYLSWKLISLFNFQNSVCVQNTIAKATLCPQIF